MFLGYLFPPAPLGFSFLSGRLMNLFHITISFYGLSVRYAQHSHMVTLFWEIVEPLWGGELAKKVDHFWLGLAGYNWPSSDRTLCFLLPRDGEICTGSSHQHGWGSHSPSSSVMMHVNMKRLLLWKLFVSSTLSWWWEK